MQMWSSDENSVRLSVCQTRELWLNGRKINADFYIMWKNIQPSFRRKRMVGGGNPFYLKFWVNRPGWSKIADFEHIIARSASVVTPSKKTSININRKSTMRFPMSLRWSSYVAPKSPKGGGSKTQNGRFSSNIPLLLKKVCYKVFLCENFQQQSCREFIGLTIYTKIIGWGHPLLSENFGQTDRVEAKSPIFDLFSPVAPQP